MSSAEFDKDSMANLTDEERAAIEDTEFSPEEIAAMRAVAGADGADGDGGDGGDDEEAGGEGTDEAGAAPATVAEPSENASAGSDTVADADSGAAPEKKAVPSPDEGKAAEFQPRYQAALPADYEANVAALKEDRRVLSEKFKAGDIEVDDYTAQMEALDDRRDELNDLRVRAAIAQDMNAQTAVQQWQFTVDRFTKNIARDENIDYRADKEKQADLDSFVKALAANVKNADKDMDWFLNEAHRRVKALHGIGSSAPAVKVDPVAPVKPSRPAPTASIPATLAQVPGSDGPGDVAGEFAELDSLEGMDYEQAIAKMTPVQRERFLQGK